MDNKPKGGRGKTAPYQTVTVRVPLPIKPLVDKLSDDFRESVSMPLIHEINKIKSSPISLEESILKAKEILKSENEAKCSMEKLLEEIYKQSINL